MEPIIKEIREYLAEKADVKIRESSKRYFKEEISCYGMKTSAVEAIEREWFKKISSLPKAKILAICESLWQSGMMEESFIACNWSFRLHKQYEPADFEVFERWIHSYVNNWASCDTLCNHTIGEFIEMYPDFLSALKRFTRSDNRWVKRAAAVSLIVPARKGEFLQDIFEIADSMLHDRDDMVQKGYGWMLKAASQAHQQEVFEFVMARKATMPRTSLRYAIEKMPPDLRAAAMAR